MTEKTLDQVKTDLAKVQVLMNGGGKDSLHNTWRFLQIYAQWGVRIPHTAESLKALLAVEDAKSYLFFEAAVQAYGSINAACKQYLTDFDEFVKLGHDLREFGEQVTPNGEKPSELDLIREFLKDDAHTAEALEGLQGLRDDAVKNGARAGKVANRLTAFKTALVDSLGQLEVVKGMIEEDNKTSRATIDSLLSQDPKKADSIAGLTALVKKYQDAYEYDVKVAATSPTYCWVNIPFPPIPAGLIAAVIVSSIYGSRAVEDKKALDGYVEELKKAQVILRRAWTAHGVQSCALQGATQAHEFTGTAIGAVTAVQQVWSGIDAGLQTVTDKLAKCLKQGDESERLAAKAFVLLYLNAIETAWATLAAPLHELLRNPYITVEPQPKTLDALLQDVA